MNYTIQNEFLVVSVNTLGAELSSVKYLGKEKLWQNETGEWAGKAPILFPVCGRCSMVVNGTTYPIPFHGFVRKAEFSLKEKTETSISFTISSSEETKKLYPYDFEFTVTYALVGSVLSIAYEVYNPADKTLYFSCGSHESYMLEKDLSEYKLVFEEDEKFVHIPYADCLTNEEIYLGEGKELPLMKEYLLDGNTLILSGIVSGGVTLAEKSGKKVADISFDGFTNLLLWRPADVQMICIEPWHTLPDRKEDEEKEFSEKDGVMTVAAKSKKTLVRTIRYY